ncbi:caspase family protein [bacterium]|nr:caspase family protein [bacterium]
MRMGPWIARSILVAGALLTAGCAQYLGYDLEDGPKSDIVTISKEYVSPRVVVIKDIGTRNHVMEFVVDGTEKFVREATYQKEIRKLHRYYEFEPWESVMEPAMVGVSAGVLPVSDLVFRILGKAGLDGYVATKTWSDRRPAFWYVRNLSRWIGWVLPGIQVFPGRGFLRDGGIGKIVEKPEPTRFPAPAARHRYTEERTGPLGAARISFDLGPAGKTTVVTDSAGRGRLDVGPYLQCLWTPMEWKIKPAILAGEKQIEAAYLIRRMATKTAPEKDVPIRYLNTANLGVTWDKPGLRPNSDPCQLESVLALTDESGDGVLEAGETAHVSLRIVNRDDLPAFVVRAGLEIQKPDQSTVGRVSETANQTARIEPGSSWECGMTWTLPEDWTGYDSLAFSAVIEDLSFPHGRRVGKTLKTRPVVPPDLKLIRCTWADGNDGLLQPGDRVNLRLRVQNMGAGKARQVRARLTASDGELTLAESFGDAQDLAPAETGEFVWNLAIPKTWRGANASGSLPVSLEILEARETFHIDSGDLGLALGQHSAIDAGASDAGGVSGLAVLARKKIAGEQARLQLERELAELAEEKVRLAKESEIHKEEISALSKAERVLRAEQEQKQAEMDRAREQRGKAARQAQSEREQLRKRSHALIVGVDTYRDPQIQPLRYAVADAMALRDALVHPRTGLFAPENVAVLVSGNPAEAAPTRIQILEELETFCATLQPEDRLLFFFAGHGMTDEKGNGNYLLPEDTTVQTIRYQGLDLTREILDALDRCAAREQIVILDACHSGFRKSVRSDDTRKIAVMAERIETALDDFGSKGSGRVVLSSSSLDQVSHEDTQIGHGVFTYFLVEGLLALNSDPLSPIDRDLDSLVEAGELSEYVTGQVRDWCRRSNRTMQVPRSRYDDSGAGIPLATGPAGE